MEINLLMEYLSYINGYAHKLEELLNADCVEVTFLTYDEDRDLESFRGYFQLYIKKNGKRILRKAYTCVEDLEKEISGMYTVAKAAKGEEC